MKIRIFRPKYGDVYLLPNLEHDEEGVEINWFYWRLELLYD